MKIRDSRTIASRAEHMTKAAIFVAIVRHGSFAAAADALGMARSTVSEHIRTLEAGFGVRLLERTTRKLRLTEEGELLYARMSSAVSAWEDVCAAFDERRDAPSGNLRITAPSGLASSLVAPVLCELLRAHPAVSTDLVVADDILDLIAEHIDVAVRMAPLEDSRFVARLLGQDSRIFVASPALASSLGTDDEALTASPWVAHSSVPSPVVDVWRDDGTRLAVRPHYRAHSSSSEGEIALVAGGAGIALLPSTLVAAALARGELVQVFPHHRGRGLPIYAVYPSRGLMPARTRAFLDLLGAAVAPV